MPKREQMLQELTGENAVGILLMAQMDGVPETVQIVVVTAAYDDKAGGLREKGHYVIRAIGVREHSFSVGIFGSLRFVDAHPLLYQYNAPAAALFFRGQVQDANALLVDVLQAYTATFGPWRQVPQYLNTAKPLLSLLNSGGDLVGEMPQPLAEALAAAFAQHNLETKLMAEPHETEDEHGRSTQFKALIIDDSYVVALDFSVDTLGKPDPKPGAK